MRLSKIKLFLLIMVLVQAIELNALDLFKYHPNSPIYFINQMEWMLQRSPHSFPINFSSFIEGYHTGKSEGGAFNNGRLGVYAGTIIPIPGVEWLSVSGNFVGAFDFFDPSAGADQIIEVTDSNGNLNYYFNVGTIFDFPVVTLGIFGGYYSDIMAQAQDVASLSEMEKEFKFTFLPIIKTANWLFFLELIANYVNFGSLFKPSNVDMGQRFKFVPIDLADRPLNIAAYYKNERYSSFARNWIYGVDFKYGQQLYACLDVGYRNFYDVASESDLNKDTVFAKLTLGYESAKENGILISGSYDFLGLGIGAGIQFFGVEVHSEVVFKDSDLSAFRLGLHLYSKSNWETYFKE